MIRHFISRRGRLPPRANKHASCGKDPPHFLQDARQKADNGENTIRILGVLLIAAGLHACGGGRDAGNVPSAEPPRDAGIILDGSETSVVYIDPDGPLANDRGDPCRLIENPSMSGDFIIQDHNRCGQKIIRETASGANISGIETEKIRFFFIVRTTNQETVENTGNHHIVPLGYAGGLPLELSAVEDNDTTFYIAAADTNITTPNERIGRAENGIIAASAAAKTARPNRACPSGSTATSTSSPKCIRIDLTRGRGASQHTARIHDSPASSWAVAKLAGYAAILREAFGIALGRDLVAAIQDGAGSDNIFSLAAALTNGNFGGISYASAGEDFADGSATVEKTMAGWTSLALTGRRATFAPGNGRDLQLAAFGGMGGDTPSHAPQSAGVALRWRGLQAGVIAERNAFLGKPSRATLGGADGRWAWLGWGGSADFGNWTLGLGAEGGLGTADASESYLVEDYGTLLTSAWSLNARYAGGGWHASVDLHQPPRTERARIRLRHGEGVVGVRPGRELRLAARLGAGPWLLSAGHVHEPGHDERARRQRGIRLDYRAQW